MRKIRNKQTAKKESFRTLFLLYKKLRFYKEKTLRGIALRRQGSQSQATHPLRHASRATSPKGGGKGQCRTALLGSPSGRAVERSETERVFCTDFLFCNSPFFIYIYFVLPRYACLISSLASSSAPVPCIVILPVSIT